jgi:hypothetical protein
MGVTLLPISSNTNYTAGIDLGGAVVDNVYINLAATLTDDDIVSKSDFEIDWPSSDNRYNHCSVRFSNEADNFKEDSVGWPPKASGTFEKGTDGRYYDQQSGWNESKGNQAQRKFLNKYAVWNGVGLEDQADGTRTFSWKVFTKTSGTYVLSLAVDNTSTVTISNSSGATILTASLTIGNGIYSTNVSLSANTVYTIYASVTDTGSLQGFAGLLKSPDGFEFWTSRNAAYSDIFVTTVNNTIYQALLAEDNGVELENDLYLEGVTDYYHALAKAEELVRTSRSAFGVNFKYLIKDKFLEPGDFIKVNSAQLGFSELYLRINEVKIEEGGVCQVKASRFDWTQLAWNVKDDEFLNPSSVYDFNIQAPYDLLFLPNDQTVEGSVG